MKKLNKLQINAEKLMKNEELVTLRGGYGGGELACKKGTETWCTFSGVLCSMSWYYCSVWCPGFDNAICAG